MQNETLPMIDILKEFISLSKLKSKERPFL
jgi:hypothetical protein